VNMRSGPRMYLVVLSLTRERSLCSATELTVSRRTSLSSFRMEERIRRASFTSVREVTPPSSTSVSA